MKKAQESQCLSNNLNKCNNNSIHIRKQDKNQDKKLTNHHNNNNKMFRFIKLNMKRLSKEVKDSLQTKLLLSLMKNTKKFTQKIHMVLL